ncbi:collagen-like protein [Algoriphagus aestuariicola]|uniref:Collagen-like protein n=1 Tax=Algoriphagus aestuariicola TaxID=1852016 RepID=A0ABS3BVX1_9BACT|nr:collagen-like protein [Algoriphagus aestuariicola]MBN7803432.1 collagen-like protein [Algoriphagus aestuariicola]
MNKILTIFALIGLVAFQACEGPEGPMGPQGEQGVQGAPGTPGVNIVGTTYEVDLDFTEEGQYSGLFEFPEALIESDAVLIYRLSAVDNGRDVWRLLPQTYFFSEGVLMYNFDYTIEDFSIFLDGAIDPTILPAQWTTDQIFRVIVLPSDFPEGRIDYSNYEAVTAMLGIEESDFQKLQANN